MREYLLIPVVALATLVFCQQENISDLQGEEQSFELISLPVRVHLLTSESIGALDCTMTQTEVRELFEGVNAIWEQAGIRWTIESISTEEAQQEEAYQDLKEAQDTLVGRGKNFQEIVRQRRQVMPLIYPRNQLLEDGWDVCVVNDLGRGLAGLYHPTNGGVVIVKQFGPNGTQGPLVPAMGKIRGPRVLAHELGHSLGLQHIDRTNENLMAPSRNVTPLTVAQIKTTREQASTGKPFRGRRSQR